MFSVCLCSLNQRRRAALGAPRAVHASQVCPDCPARYRQPPSKRRRTTTSLTSLVPLLSTRRQLLGLCASATTFKRVQKRQQSSGRVLVCVLRAAPKNGPGSSLIHLRSLVAMLSPRGRLGLAVSPPSMLSVEHRLRPSAGRSLLPAGCHGAEPSPCRGADDGLHRGLHRVGSSRRYGSRTGQYSLQQSCEAQRGGRSASTVGMRLLSARAV